MSKLKTIEKEFRKLFPDTDNSVLSKKYNVAESVIRTWGASLGLRKNNWHWNSKDVDFVVKNYNKGKYTINDIAKKLKRSRWAVINKYREIMGL